MACFQPFGPRNEQIRGTLPAVVGASSSQRQPGAGRTPCAGRGECVGANARVARVRARLALRSPGHLRLARAARPARLLCWARSEPRQSRSAPADRAPRRSRRLHRRRVPPPPQGFTAVNLLACAGKAQLLAQLLHAASRALGPSVGAVIT